MGWVGLWYALSQGFFAKQFIRMAGEDPTNVNTSLIYNLNIILDNLLFVFQVILICLCFLALGRVAAMMTTEIEVVYAVMAAVIVALGVVNTAISSAASTLADATQIGGLFGILEAVESMSGLVGPAIGGLLFRSGPRVPLYSVVCIYSVLFVAVMLFYRSTIVSTNKTTAVLAPSEEEKKAKKEE